MESAGGSRWSRRFFDGSSRCDVVIEMVAMTGCLSTQLFIFFERSSLCAVLFSAVILVLVFARGYQNWMFQSVKSFCVFAQ